MCAKDDLRISCTLSRNSTVETLSSRPVFRTQLFSWTFSSQDTLPTEYFQSSVPFHCAPSNKGV